MLVTLKSLGVKGEVYSLIFISAMEKYIKQVTSCAI